MKETIIGLLLISSFASCNQVGERFKSGDPDSTQAPKTQNPDNKAVARDQSITKENAYSDLFLDSAAVEGYIKKEILSSSSAEALRNFYAMRNNQFAWLNSNGLTEQARGLWSLYSSENKSAGNEPGAKIKEKMDTLLVQDSMLISSTDTASMQTELTLTAQLVQYATENKSPVTQRNFYFLVPVKKQDPLQLADSLLNKQNDTMLYAGNKTYNDLKARLSVYYNSAKTGGWQPILTGNLLKKGGKSATVKALKKRLQATNDYSLADTTNVFSDTLTAAIKSIQQLYGLQATGIVTDSLLKELNVPAEDRIQQIVINMNRALWKKPAPDNNLIVVNIPSLELNVYEGNRKVMRMPVIVGKEGTGTMVFSGAIDKIVFSPYWNLPQSIVQNEIKPAMAKDRDYLKKHNMEIVKQDDSMPKIRQLPGRDNALGRVKFLFPNSFDIYLHDTPDKTLFAQKNRALSHGCIRVANPDSLAHYLLHEHADWTPDKIITAMNSNKEQTVTLKNPRPVFITYYTSWVDETGKLNFRPDIYGHDKTTKSKMFAPKLPA
jgi:murein L,D-transpeptidase YcbB/YkuD